MTMNLFQKWAATTLVAILVLICVGGLVRVLGAGLGCPDWPSCWGHWLPPASLEEVDVSAVYEKFKENPKVQREYPDLTEDDVRALFHPTKMWVEYGNRILGVVIGFLVFGTLLLSIPYARRNSPTFRPVVFWGSLVAFFLVGFQGWLGGQVVRSGLHQGMITLHMLVAQVLFCLLIYIMFRASDRLPGLPAAWVKRWRPWIWLFLVCAVIQIGLGTQVREAIDTVAGSHDRDESARATWLGLVGWWDHVHRFFAWSLLFGAGLIWLQVRRTGLRGGIQSVASLLLFSVLAQIGIGVALAYGGLPQWAQVAHLGGSSLIVCFGFLLVLLARSPLPLIAEDGELGDTAASSL